MQVECVLKPRCKKCMEKGMGRPSRRSLYTGNVIQNLAASLSKSYSVNLFSPFISLFGFGPLGGCDTESVFFVNRHHPRRQHVTRLTMYLFRKSLSL